jgi:hypothetical protein
MDGVILGRMGSIHLAKRENTLQLECVLFGEGYCVNPSTPVFNVTLDISEDNEESVKAESNNVTMMSIWTWMTTAGVKYMSHLEGHPVLIQVENDELKNFQVITEERAAELVELSQKQEETSEEEN